MKRFPAAALRLLNKADRLHIIYYPCSPPIRECLCRDPENWTANGAEHGNSITETTLWSDCPLEIASQGETIGGLQRLMSSSFRRPYTEVKLLLYVLSELLSITFNTTVVVQRKCHPKTVQRFCHPLG